MLYSGSASDEERGGGGATTEEEEEDEAELFNEQLDPLSLLDGMYEAHQASRHALCAIHGLSRSTACAACSCNASGWMGKQHIVRWLFLKLVVKLGEHSSWSASRLHRGPPVAAYRSKRWWLNTAEFPSRRAAGASSHMRCSRRASVPLAATWHKLTRRCSPLRLCCTYTFNASNCRRCRQDCMLACVLLF